MNKPSRWSTSRLMGAMIEVRGALASCPADVAPRFHSMIIRTGIRDAALEAVRVVLLEPDAIERRMADLATRCQKLRFTLKAAANQRAAAGSMDT
jgi:hypothetical protein